MEPEIVLSNAEPRKRRHERPLDPAATVIRPRHLRAVTGLSVIQIWRLRKAGTFPACIRLGRVAIGFLRSDVDAWLRERQQAGR